MRVWVGVRCARGEEASINSLGTPGSLSPESRRAQTPGAASTAHFPLHAAEPPLSQQPPEVAAAQQASERASKQARAPRRMVCALLLGLAALCCPLAALVLDYNTIRGSAEVQSGGRKGRPCQGDRDCRAGQFCLRSDAKVSSCATCHGLRRRCQSSAMCCPGIQCLDEVCAKLDDQKQLDIQRGPISESRIPAPLSREKRLKKKAGTTAAPAAKGQEGASCLRSHDCDEGLCCARHFWTKICKPVLIAGQVCSGRKHKDPAQRPEIFQRCDCGPGLTCRQQSRAAKPRSRLRVCQQ
ncbi:dickkopf-related protein 4 [Ambystoma mexicanum]|uniref:dickkopf-related protein 4 n=1 Tax=Ambystoma mexicanum TaxID=8296 RepID=UPI0037E933D8